MEKRHNVFVSYHHANDEYYRDEFERLFSDKHNIMVSKSVQLGDIDPNLKTETIRRKIRDEYLRDSSVLVVLIGKDTWKRKYIDWEISSSIRQTKFNKRMGLIGILLPSHPNYGKKTYNPHTIPPRLYDNLGNGFATIHNWSTNKAHVQSWIHKAFDRRFEIDPDNSRDLFRNNRSADQKEWQ
jgi:hypothetical protein